MARIRSSRRARPTHLLAGLTLATSLVIPALQTPAAVAASPQASPATQGRGDFNGDGFADLAVSIPLATVTFPSQGAVAVIYGSANGLDPKAKPSQFLTEISPNGPQQTAAWGLSLAVGDFNGDGYGDLAVGANGSNIGSTADNGGSVTVFSGSKAGLSPKPTAYITELMPAPGSQFGFFLAAADFNGDRRDDLAVNALNKTVGTLTGTGAVFMYRGGAATPSGLNPNGPIQLDESSPHVPGTARPGDQFGAAMAAGDMNGDGRADLAVGVPGRMVGGKAESGTVFVFNGCAAGGSCNGLVSTDGQDFKLNELSGRTTQTGALFGLSLAIGNFGRNGAQDLAIGIPGYKVNGLAGAGAVGILYSSGSAGLSVNDYTFLVEGAAGLPGAPGANDNFGDSLAAGNLGKSSQADLAIGTPFKTVTVAGAALGSAGQVHVVYGSETGLTTAGSQLFTQASAGIPGDVTAAGGFGKTLIIAPFAGGQIEQLAVASRDTVDGQVHAGAVTILPGGTAGIAASPKAQYLTATTAKIGHPAAAEELFGGAFGQPGLAG